MSSSAARPLVSVYSTTEKNAVTAQAKLPAVFLSPIRPDLIRHTYSKMAKNSRQPYAVKHRAGMGHSALSWGTGRAVSRIPRVKGGGTSRAGQAAFGNMCRKGRMFAPTRIWRKWHVKINVNERRYAIVSALAASASFALVSARGHRVEQIPHVPLVLAATAEAIQTTKAAKELLAVVNAGDDVDRVQTSKKIRAGRGKIRNRRYRQRVGPLVVYAEDSGIRRAFANLGVDTANVNALNLLDLAPGGHSGRFIIWTQGAFEKLDSIYGTFTKESEAKSGYKLPAHMLKNADLASIINSSEIQSVLREKKETVRRDRGRKNPLKNAQAMYRLNPYAQQVKRTAILANTERTAKRATRSAAHRAASKARAAKLFADA